MKSTKKALLMSALSLLLCCSMLIGTTFAWFTDEVKSGNNIIAAGNLDIELYHSDSAVKNEKVNGGTKLFDDVSSQLWEPGAVAYEVLTVVNEGTLALKYNLAFHALNATVVNGKSLANVLKIAVVDASKLTSREAAIAAGAGEWTALNSFDLPGVLEAEESETYGIVIYWEPSSNDNDFNMNNENQGKILSVFYNVFHIEDIFIKESLDTIMHSVDFLYAGILSSFNSTCQARIDNCGRSTGLPNNNVPFYTHILSSSYYAKDC